MDSVVSDIWGTMGENLSERNAGCITIAIAALTPCPDELTETTIKICLVHLLSTCFMLFTDSVVIAEGRCIRNFRRTWHDQARRKLL